MQFPNRGKILTSGVGQTKTCPVRDRQGKVGDIAMPSRARGTEAYVQLQQVWPQNRPGMASLFDSLADALPRCLRYCSSVRPAFRHPNP
jgi:hypothetical protein